MADFDLIMGAFWIICGLVILVPASLIARGRADLHVHYDESVDPAYVSRRAGITAIAMGVLPVTYGLFQITYGYHPYAFGGLLLSLLVLSSLTKRFAQGWGSGDRTP
ncbi:hypothetical protein OB955_21130 [Halobacteria archaeon AArc-m2/3/4]|uniref:DUF3784 domain-containing protein n=1 Tax=Natronoglomus mannanivorans TaxID=2979990 RepID=A0AAP2YYG2_9EURY|nr:hypothetical protein [Halobacteria archaeon AArc-xg1-1]MCU4975208.1 hypothetical protein [Halobacteria archaeon AArc-m2/3/4]